MFSESPQRAVDLVFLFIADERVLPGGGRGAVDVTVVEVFQAGGEPLVLMVQQHELQRAGEVVQVLAGVEQVHDLGGLRELRGSDSPDPCCSVAEDGELADVVRAAADAFCLHEVREDRGGLEGGDDAGGGPVADRGTVPLCSSSWVKKTPSLTSRVRARPSSPLPLRPALSRPVSWGRRCR